MIEQPPRVPPVNRNAIISVITGVLTLLSFCTAVAPVPLTGYVCYPAAAVLGTIALVTGLTALLQIRRSKENGRSYALAGVWIGGLAVVASVLATVLGILLLPKVFGLLHQYLK
jgi:hypothetical protein